MKSALKKVLSLMLVAMLLVSAIPFQASALAEVGAEQPSAGDITGAPAPQPNDTLLEGVGEDDSTKKTPEDQAANAPAPQSNDTLLEGKAPEGRAMENGTTKEVTVYLNNDGGTVYTTRPDATIEELVTKVLGSNYSAKFYVTVSTSEKELGENFKNEQVGTASYIKIKADQWNIDITVTIEGGASGTVKKLIDSDVILNDQLLKDAGVNVPSDKKVFGWKVKNENKDIGQSVKAEWGLEVIAVLIDSNQPTPTPTPTSGTVQFVVKVDGKIQTVNGVQEQAVTPSQGNSVVVKNLLKYYFDKDWESKYTFSHYWIKGETGKTHDGAAVLNDQITVGNTIHVALTTKGGTGTTPGTTPGTVYTLQFFNTSGQLIGSREINKGEKLAVVYAESYAKSAIPSGYTFAGWKTSKNSGTLYSNQDVANMAVNGNMAFYAVATKNDSTTTPTTGSNKFPYKVYLHIYLNNKVDEPARNVNITDGIAVDGVVNKAEVEGVVKQYYSAKNSDGIKYDGLYMARGNWVSNFANDLKKYDQITGILDMRQESEVHINVMVTNANAKSTSNNNSTNPKTGDSIVMTVSALGITASALAAAYYVSKKRMAK